MADRFKVRPAWHGRRRWLFVGLVVAGLLAAWYLKLGPRAITSGSGSWEIFKRFLMGAFQPALDYERTPPPGTTPFLWRVVEALWATVRYAVTAVSIAVVAGLVFGYAGSTLWLKCGNTENCCLCAFRRVVYVIIRVGLSLVRSVHELIWAVLLLAAVGLSPLAVVLALAIPYAGAFGKIFSELFEEHAEKSAEVLRAMGAGSIQAFLFGILPRAWPDCLSYVFYRLECALRSSAVLGFMGVLTVGYYLRLATEEGHYREVWTYLYALLILIALFDFWSGRIRKRLQVGGMI